MNKNAPVNLLWTSGWDSTFRLLELVLVENRAVQPLYVLTYFRNSLRKEILQQNKIKSEIAKRYPHKAHLILPTLYANASDLRKDSEHSAYFATLREKYKIGFQYEWLAFFLLEYGLSSVEIGLTKGGFTSLFESCLESFREEGAARDNYRLGARLPEPALALFSRYHMPLVKMTKQDMLERAKAHGFDDLMLMTWFCYNPRGITPCGKCSPCRQAVDAGFGWRVEGSKTA